MNKIEFIKRAYYSICEKDYNADDPKLYQISTKLHTGSVQLRIDNFDEFNQMINNLITDGVNQQDAIFIVDKYFEDKSKQP